MHLLYTVYIREINIFRKLHEPEEPKTQLLLIGNWEGFVI